MARQVRAAITRERIAIAARTLFSQVSYQDVTLRAIAEQAGRTTSLIFRYWPDKAQLWTEVMNCPPPVDSPQMRAARVSEAACSQAVLELRAIAQSLWPERATLASRVDAVARSLSSGEPNLECADQAVAIADAPSGDAPLDATVEDGATGAAALELSIGRRLRSLRRQLGLSLGDMARRLNMSTTQMSRYETGRSPISAAQLIRLASAFGWSIDELFASLHDPQSLHDAAGQLDTRS